jgi:hypothetical protein
VSGNLVLYPLASGGSAPITPDTYRQIVVTRDPSGTVAGHVDGILALGPHDDSSTGTAALTKTLCASSRTTTLSPPRSPPARSPASASTRAP